MKILYTTLGLTALATGMGLSLIPLTPVQAATYDFKFISDTPGFGQIGSGSLNLNFIPRNVTLNLQSILANSQGSYTFDYIAFCAPGTCAVDNNGNPTGQVINQSILDTNPSIIYTDGSFSTSGNKSNITFRFSDLGEILEIKQFLKYPSVIPGGSPLNVEERINFSGETVLARYNDQVYNSNTQQPIAGATDNGRIEFTNNIEVTPEPGTVVSLGILGLGLVVVRKNTRK
jgi:hypothetical protein